ncbi:MAG: transposase [Clostridia bacterium]|nr:transposase [Clostridia bacterium]
MKCEAIFADSASYSVRKMCKVPGLREAVRCRRKKAEERRNRRIREEREDILAVKEVFEEHHRIYGCRRMLQALENRGKIMSEWHIRRIMRENGLYQTRMAQDIMNNLGSAGKSIDFWRFGFYQRQN